MVENAMSEEHQNEEKLGEIIQFIAALSRLDFSKRITFGGSTDLDTIAGGLNWLAEEFDHSVVSKNKLERINKELEQFAYITSHDLKSPVRAMGTLVSFIREDLKEGKMQDVANHLDMMETRVQRMENLINGILTYSKLGEIKVENIELEKLISEILDDYLEDTRGNLKMTGTFPTIQGDRIQIFQLFSNLITNAFKYNDKEQAVVTVSSLDNENYHKISVEDNGPGIEEAFHDKIFQMFQTLKRKDDFESTGIGLAIVKKIIESHKGKIEVESKKGVGTKFIVYLPK